MLLLEVLPGERMRQRAPTPAVFQGNAAISGREGRKGMFFGFRTLPAAGHWRAGGCVHPEVWMHCRTITRHTEIFRRRAERGTIFLRERKSLFPESAGNDAQLSCPGWIGRSALLDGAAGFRALPAAGHWRAGRAFRRLTDRASGHAGGSGS